MGIGDFFNKIKFKFYLKINFINFNINNIRNQNVYFNNNTSYNYNKNKYIFNSYIIRRIAYQE